MRRAVCSRKGIGSRVLQTIHRVRLCVGCGDRESRQSRMLQGSDRGLIARCRSGRRSARSRGRRSGVRRRNLTRANLESAGDVVLHFLVERHARRSGLGRRGGRSPRPKVHRLLFLSRIGRRCRRRSRPSHCVLSNLSNLFNQCDGCQTPCLIGIPLVCQSIQFELSSAHASLKRRNFLIASSDLIVVVLTKPRTHQSLCNFFLERNFLAQSVDFPLSHLDL